MKIVQRVLGVLAVITLLSTAIALIVYYMRPSKNLDQTDTAPKIEFDTTESAVPHAQVFDDTVNVLNETTETVPLETRESSLPLTETVEKPSALTGWRIQMGVFNQAGNAERLVKNLRKKNFQVVSRQIFIRKELMTQVLVGPVADEEAAKKLQLQLENSFNIKGRILFFELDKNTTSL